MKRRSFLSAASCAPLLGMTGQAEASGNADDGTNSSGVFDIVAEFTGPGPSGVAVLPDGRLFVSFPRHADNHPGATLGEVKNGKIIPYPSAEVSLPSNRAPADRLMSVHGLALDSQNRLWLIDDGKLAKHDIPEGAAKIICIDPATDKIVHRIVLKAPAMRPDSHMNDLRVALSVGERGTVFVTDSSFGTEPALVVADIATGEARRVLAHHPSTQAVEGFMAIVEGEPGAIFRIIRRWFQVGQTASPCPVMNRGSIIRRSPVAVFTACRPERWQTRRLMIRPSGRWCEMRVKKVQQTGSASTSTIVSIRPITSMTASFAGTQMGPL